MPASSKAKPRPRTSRSTRTIQTRARSKPTPKCYLVTLPPEIRHMILEYLLLQPTYFGVRQVYGERFMGVSHGYRPEQISYKNILADIKRVERRDRVEMLRALTSTCKTLYFDSVALYYNKHGFVFHSINSLGSVLKGLGSGRRSQIRDVTFTLEEILGRNYMYDGREATRAITLLGECNLKKLTVRVGVNTGETAANNLFRVRGVKKLREIRGCKEVHVEQTSLGRYEAEWGFPLKFNEEQIEAFQRVLRRELCQEREQIQEFAK